MSINRLNPDEPDAPMNGLHIGVVVENEDPEGLGRVRLRIPGVIEPASPWAWPLGSPGGGTKDRGVFWVPDVGSEIGVFFKMGDPDHPYYLPSNWGAPGGNSEVPEASDGGNPNVRAMAFGQYDVVIDNREASKKLRLVDKEDGENIIEFNGNDKTLLISSKTAIAIQSTGQVDISGLIVTINGVPAGQGKV